jgi:succinylglutamate desuccinylase
MLKIIDHIPEGLLTCSATTLYQVLSQPTLIHLSGRRSAPLFVSVLLHGNETSGLYALQKLLKKYQQKPLPRALSVFIGNVQAARYSQRRLDTQPDYNRVWPGQQNITQQLPLSPEQKMMREIIDALASENIFASIDIHNNTGRNPHYACINRLESDFFHLATLFSRTVVYFTRPDNVQSMAFSVLCPAVTIECGKPEQPHGAEHALEFIDTCLHLNAFPAHDIAKHDIDLFHTVAIVKIPRDISISFDEAQNISGLDQYMAKTIYFSQDLDHLNFHELSTGTSIAHYHATEKKMPLIVTDENGNDASTRFFTLRNGEICTAREIMPSMFTLDADIIHQDCLGYLMERLNW